jgi:hypothetical protein
MNSAIPKPTVMPLDRQAWRQELHISNFINTYYQYRDLRALGPDIKRILIIGPGQGLDTALLKWRGFEVTTFDIDSTFEPDVTGSVHDLTMFETGRFDAAIASHVLEHFAVPYLDAALGEIARVARYALVYLPVHGCLTQLRLVSSLRGIDLSLILDIFNWFRQPDGVTARYSEGQHFWEVGMRGFRVPDLIERFTRFYEVLDSYRNRDWMNSYNFVLRSKGHGV